ncbi:extracellular calcium-sensing receptor-like [Rhinatrema bivittatum]|uniref:extracellular calcium-sensing receptor-like n=1 Tax=Rhinatrema bivittatum TaxID=194408 RepID=UPI00112E2B35|nr:extracellular calcium-sensing receptor-like [Rhinatrema bivittatum]
MAQGIAMILLAVLPSPCMLTQVVGCRLPQQEVRTFHREGDIVLGGIILVHWKHSLPDTSFREEPSPISCADLQVRSYREVLVFVFAVQQINQNPNVLPNITLGFRILDACLSRALAVASTLSLLSGTEDPMPNYHCLASAPILGVVGEAAAFISVSMASLLGVYKIPQISYGSSVSVLSDKVLYPSFFRTIPNNLLEVQAMAHLLQYFGWSWVGILAEEDNEYGVGSDNLRKEIIRSGGCVAFLEKIPVVLTKERMIRIVETVRNSTAKVIVIYTHVSNVVSILNAVAKENIQGKIWFGTTAFIITPDLFPNDTWQSLNGTLAMALHVRDIPEFKDFVYSIQPSTSADDIFIKTVWEKAFICKWQEEGHNQTHEVNISKDPAFCTGTERVEQMDPVLFDLNNLRFTYNVYVAVYAFAHALHNLLSCKSGDGSLSIGSCAMIDKIHPQEVLHHLRHVHFVTGSGEEVFFDENGDPPALYDILNWQIFPNGTYQCLTVGSFNFSAPQGKQVFLNHSSIIWNSIYSKVPDSVCSASCPPGFRKAAREGEPVCCFDCVPCADGEITNQTDATDCQKCPDDKWSNRNRDICIPRIIEFLSYGEPLGALLSSIAILCSLVTFSIMYIFITYKDTPIVKANNRELSYLLLLSLMFCFLCSFLFIGRPTRISCMLRQTAFGVIFSLSVSCILAKTIIVVVAFNATKPNSALKKWVGTRIPSYLVPLCSVIQFILCLVWLGSAPPYSSVNLEIAQKIIIQCSEGSIELFYAMLGYLGFLACVSFIVAFLARNLPDSFNEAKYITFSLLVFVSVWISFIPAYLSTRGKYMVAVEVFAILTSSTGLLSCIFFPKVYIILLKPDRNTKDYLLEKTSARSRTEFN